MAESPQRLGRGLAALLGGPATVAAEGAGTGLMEVDVAAIRPNAKQPRRRFDPDALQVLAESIAGSGLVQPVVVRPVGDGGYELIAGERRWRAAQEAGVARIPALVRDADERERLELALVENVVREDLNPMELARAVAALVEDFGQTHAQVATTMGRSRPAITNLLRLLELPDPVQELVEAGTLSEGHARAVLVADGARARRELAERAVAEGWSVRQIEAAGRGAGVPSRRTRRSAADPSPTVDRALEQLYALFLAPVRIKTRAAGRIVVEVDFDDEAALAARLDDLGADR